MSQIKAKNDDWHEIEKDWLNSLPRFTDSVLIDAFSDGILDLDDKLLNLKDEVNVLVSTIKERSRPCVGKTDEDSLFMLQFIKHWYVTDLIKIENNIQFIERLQNRLREPSSSSHKMNALSEKEIEIARAVPITRVAESYLEKIRRVGKNYRGHCPFHCDNSPSLVIYTDSNRFYCFGCHISGDVITFTQKLLATDFKSTINYLLNS